MKRALLVLLAVTLPGPAMAQNVFLNPISAANPVPDGGTEDQFALDNANRAAPKIQTASLATRVQAGPVNSTSSAAVDAANLWKADVFVTIASDAGGGHGPETFYFSTSTSGKTLATDLQVALLAQYTLPNRGETSGATSDGWYVLKTTTMPAAVSFVVFHDCVTSHASLPNAASESVFLRDPNGRELISTGLASGTCKFLGKTCPVACTPSQTQCGSSCCDNATQVCDTGSNTCVPKGTCNPGTACDTGKKGVCQAGTIQCPGNVCVQTVPSSSEKCDGLDNNCDGSTDENDPGGGGSCLTGNLGVCSSGTVHCQAGHLTCVQNVQSSKEICDGLDNNCDGRTDENCFDAGLAGADPTRTPGPHAAQPGGDAAQPPGRDASAQPGADATTQPGPDAESVPGEDASLSGEDAAEPAGEDASDADDNHVVLGPDTGPKKKADAGTGGPSGGCGCGAQGQALAPLAVALAALVRRRRPRLAHCPAPRAREGL
jgi:hypothetical protein